jgi:outer membrane PBP1 activator LpoA protein
MPSSTRRGLSWSDRAQAIATTLTGLAAVAALIFTAQSLRATDKQLSQNEQQVNINEQGQITDRFNAAITNLASSKTVVQLGGIYALQRIMDDSARDQPAVLNTLCAYIRFRDSLPGKVPAPVNTSELLPLSAKRPWHQPNRTWVRLFWGDGAHGF